MHKKTGVSGASSIGVIGGADGPTAIFIRRNRKQEKWAQERRRAIEALKPGIACRERPVTGEELRAYLMESYGAVERPVREREKLGIRLNLLHQRFPELLGQRPMPPKEAGRKALLAWVRERHEAAFSVARNLKDEDYGLSYAALTIPRTERTERYFREEEEFSAQMKKRHARRGWLRRLFKGRRCLAPASEPPVRIEVLLELSTGQLELHGGSASLWNELTLWRGVTKEDVENETPAFLSYAHALLQACQNKTPPA